MTELSKLILEKYQVRKTKAQKLEFIDMLRGYFPELIVEESGLIRSRNIVIGDVDQAKVVMGAHYDTCAQLPFPNMIAPKNFVFTLGYSVLTALPFLLLMMFLMEFLNFLNPDLFLVNYWISFAVMMGALLSVFMLGKPNQHTANDNTSGVITLLELLAALTPEQREKVAIVLFDNEENGLLGSSQFNKKHKAVMKQKLLINLDCVSDGDHMLFVRNKPAIKTYGELLDQCFVDTEEKTVHMEKSSNTFYPSDQKNFPIHVAISSMNKKRFIGLYMDKIHTKKDVVFEESNMEYLCNGLQMLVERIG